MVRRLVFLLVLAVACTDPEPRATPTPEPTPVETPTTAAPTTTAPARTRTPTPTNVDYVFPIVGCRTSYARVHHDYPATDIMTRAGCVYVSPVAGRVDEVSRVDRWNPAIDHGATRGGLFVSVVGVDGVRYYGSHLRAVADGIRPGLRVKAGARLGEVGTTGSARGTDPHLHFGISWPTDPGVWQVRRGVVHPWPYLDSWRTGGDRSPAAEVRRAEAAAS